MFQNQKKAITDLPQIQMPCHDGAQRIALAGHALESLTWNERRYLNGENACAFSNPFRCPSLRLSASSLRFEFVAEMWKSSERRTWGMELFKSTSNSSMDSLIKMLGRACVNPSFGLSCGDDSATSKTDRQTIVPCTSKVLLSKRTSRCLLLRQLPAGFRTGSLCIAQ